MKPILRNTALMLTIIFATIDSQAQIVNPGRKVKEKGEQRANDRIDQGIDRGFDKIDEGIGGLFKGKKKRPKNDEAYDRDNDESTSSGGNSTSDNQSGTTAAPTTQKSNSKFDFVAGTQVMYATNFANEAIGDFPVDFNTNASGEVVTLSGKSGRWLSMNKNGAYIPEGIKNLPDNFTLEFEVGIIGDPSNNYSGFGVNFTTVKEELMKDVLFGLGTSAVWLHPGASLASIGVFPSSGAAFLENDVPMPQWNVSNKTFAKVSIWRQKGRLRMYVNQDKVLDVPRFFVESSPYELAFFRRLFNDCEIVVTNIRFAIAGADTRTKLLQEGRFVTNEILFDVNSDVIKQESHAAIKDIGNVLRENPNINVKIVGHTDSDGDAAANLQLSKKRAEAVKSKLVKDYSISSSRLTTDGKGESALLNTNSNDAAKAQNRRVEFIRQ